MIQSLSLHCSCSSPKHSPAHIPSSPKHTITGISSPKSHGASPKHPSMSGSGKPSMSTLKSAANSPSSKSSGEKKSSSKESSRDKEKKVSSLSMNNKIKSSSVKLKQLELNTNIEANSVSQDGLSSPSGTVDLSKSLNSNQVRNRKGSLSAIVDKLKSAAHCDIPTDLSSKSSNRERPATQSNSGKSESSKSISKVCAKRLKYF